MPVCSQHVGDDAVDGRVTWIQFDTCYEQVDLGAATASSTFEKAG